MIFIELLTLTRATNGSSAPLPFTEYPTLTTSLSNDRLVVNVGYSVNGKGAEDPFVAPIRVNNSININFGLKFSKFEYGTYYGYGGVQQFYKSDIYNRTIDPYIGDIHYFGAYSNFYLLSFQNFENNEIQTALIYLTGKFGGYNARIHDENFSLSGLTYFGGIGASYYIFKNYGVFFETGHSWYHKINQNNMSMWLFRVGVTAKF